MNYVYAMYNLGFYANSSVFYAIFANIYTYIIHDIQTGSCRTLNKITIIITIYICIIMVDFVVLLIKFE